MRIRIHKVPPDAFLEGFDLRSYDFQEGQVYELTHQLADYFGAKDGVLVTAVTDGSAAAKAGIKAGDVITSVNGERVTSRADLVSALRRADNEEVTVGIVRDKKETSVKAKIEAPRRTLRGARPA